jgi:N-acetylglucosamine repressor
VRAAKTEAGPLSDHPVAIKPINQLRILNALRYQPGLSRAAMARQIGLGKATISTIVADFIARGLVHEDGPEGDHSLAGRRPTRLQLNGEAFVAIGMELTGHECIAVLTDLAGRCLRTLRRPTPNTTVEGAIAILADALAELTEGRDIRRLAGVGVGIPGVIDAAAQRVVLAENIEWVDVPFAHLLQEAIGHRVSIINRTNAGALGEYWHGSGKAVEDMVYVSISVGIGAGIIIDGRLHQGANGSAGEIGHITVEPNGHRCACGNIGCLETLVSTPAIVVRAKQHIKEGEHSVLETLTGGHIARISASMVVDAALQEDAVAVAVMQEAGTYLGIALANVINLVNPSLVVVDGEMLELGDLFLETVRKTVNRRTFSVPRAAVKVVPSDLGHLASAIGAATLIIDQLFSSPTGILGASNHSAGTSFRGDLQIRTTEW